MCRCVNKTASSCATWVPAAPPTVGGGEGGWAVLPHEIAAGRSLILELGTARAENLYFHAASAACAGRGDRRCEQVCAQQCNYRASGIQHQNRFHMQQEEPRS